MWYDTEGNEKDVVLSSRIRLARNIVDYPFPGRLDSKLSDELKDRIIKAYENAPGFRKVSYEDSNKLQKYSDVEKHIISKEYADSEGSDTLIVDDSDNIYVMVMEEDHVRIQSVFSGYDIDAAYVNASKAAKILSDNLKVAYDDRLGYLTHCPTNLGTGMRASVMMFLPMLTLSGKIGYIQNQLGKHGLTIRGMNGEGSNASGCLYQISNQVTLGLSEQDIINKLKTVVSSIITNERRLRKSTGTETDINIADGIMRSYGVLKYARKIDTKELFKVYADVRLGISEGLISDISYEQIDEILIKSLPNTLTLDNKDKQIKSFSDRDIVRADYIRSAV